jgi:hypothetical protein
MLKSINHPSEINKYNLNNVRCEASIHFRNKMREYLKDKINEHANRKNKKITDLYRRINKFKRVYHSRSNSVKDENGDLLADFHSILFSQYFKWVEERLPSVAFWQN